MSSCKTSVADSSKDSNSEIVSTAQDFTILSAIKSRWIGGREGVGGNVYNITLKNNKKDYTYKFLNLVTANGKLPVKTSLMDGIIVAVAMSTDPRSELYVDDGKADVPTSKTENSTDNNFYLEYTLGNSKTIKKLKITSFKQQ